MGQLAISWSQLRAHSECKNRSHLLRSGKRAKTQNIRMYFPGSVVDRVMREYLDCGDNQIPGMMADNVARIMDREEEHALSSGDGVVIWKSKDDRKEALVFCQELCHKLEPILEQYVLTKNPTSAYRFKAPITIPYVDYTTKTTIRLIGEMDILCRTPDFTAVYDLKATIDDQYYRKTMGQMVFYDLAVFAETGSFTDEVGLIQPMCKKAFMPWTITDQQRTEMLQAIISMAHDIWKNNQELRPDTTKCGFCVVRHACSRYNVDDWDDDTQLEDLDLIDTSEVVAD